MIADLQTSGCKRFLIGIQKATSKALDWCWDRGDQLALCSFAHIMGRWWVLWGDERP